MIRKIQIKKYKKRAVNRNPTRAAKAVARKEHISANREVRKSVKIGKWNFDEGVAEEAKRKAAIVGTYSNCYMIHSDTTKTLA